MNRYGVICRVLAVAAVLASMPVSASAAPGTQGAKVGDVIKGEHVGVVVPPRGRAVTAIVEREDGSAEVLTASTSADGEVSVSAGTAPSPVSLALALDECADDRSTLLESYYTWSSSPVFAFRAQSTPSELSAGQAESGVMQALANISGGRNVCGHPDGVDLDAVYGGRTSRGASMFTGANNLICDTARADGGNVIAFGDRNGDLASACLAVDLGMTRMVEADILLDRAQKEWYLVGQTPCQQTRRSVEAVVTHELGHAFGMLHVVGSAELTMSDNGIPACQNTESSLGLGDLLGLEARY